MPPATVQITYDTKLMVLEAIVKQVFYQKKNKTLGKPMKINSQRPSGKESFLTARFGSFDK